MDGLYSTQYHGGYINTQMKPISKLRSAFVSYEAGEEPERLHELRKSLLLNLRTQEKLRKIRDDISARLHNLDEFISTYRLRTEYPPASSILSYLKFQRNTPHSLKEQSKVIEMQEAIKNSGEEDFQFMKKLNEDRPSKKRKEINFAELPKEACKINFLELSLSSSTYKTGLEVYKAWLDFNKKKTPKRPYTNIEEEILIEKQKIYKDNWEKICQFIENRSFQEIYYEFHNRINPHMRTGRWSYRQTMMLVVLLEHYGIKNWAKIAEKMKIKSQLQVRERFCNIIDPNLGRNIWTPAMEAKLLDVVKDYGFSWKEMAKLSFFENKTDNCIWRKFRNIMIKKEKEEIYDFMKDCQKKELVEKIVNYKELIDTKKERADQRIRQRKEAAAKRLMLQKELLAAQQAQQVSGPMQVVEKQEMMEENQMLSQQRMIYMLY